MTKNIRRILAGAVAAAVLAAVSVLSGVVSPANAATDYWVEKYDDHTDIVVDWFAVDDVAADPVVVSRACEDMTTWYQPIWGAFEYSVCMAWVEDCALKADTNYPNHAIRVGFYSTGRTCSVIGVG